MIIGYSNSYIKNSYMNNNFKKVQKLFDSKNNFYNIEKNQAMQKEIMKQKIDNMKFKLRVSKESETQILDGMSILKEKELGLNKIKAVGNKLEELCKQYKKPDLNEKDKAEIEKKAAQLLKGLEKLMNNPKEVNSIGDKILHIDGSDMKSSIILSKSINITLGFGKLDDMSSDEAKKRYLDGKHFESKVSIKTLLENPSIIEERILKPVQDCMEKVNNSKSFIYNKFIKEYSVATNSIDGLFKSGAINPGQKSKEILEQKSIYEAVSGLYFQSSNIDNDNIYELLR